jgi:hypothetical protein
MRKLLAVLVLAGASRAGAGEPWPSHPTAYVGAEDAEQVVETPPPRLRFGIGFASGAVDVGGSDPLVTVGGLELRGGIQLSDLMAVLYQGSFTLMWPDLRQAVLVELTPTWLGPVSLATGFGADWMLAAGPIAVPLGPAGGGLFDTSRFNQFVSLGIPVRIALDIPVISSTPGHQRQAFSISLELDPSIVVLNDTYRYLNPFRDVFQMGFVAGMGYELY